MMPGKSKKKGTFPITAHGFSKIGIGILLLFISIHLRAQTKDTIVLYNGQVLIGDVLGVESGVLSLKDVDLNGLKIRLNKIRTFRTLRPFKVETTERNVFYG